MAPDADAVNPDLGVQVNARPRVAATDGGEILGVGDDGTDAERPVDCECGAWNADAALPCWACFRDGVEPPAPLEGE